MVVQGLAYAWVQFYLPLPIVLTLNSASPIFTAIFDTILYGVHLNWAQKLWLALAFLGVMLTANGNYLTFLLSGAQSSPDSKFQNYKTDDPVVMLGAAVIFTLVMCLHGWGMVITKKLKKTNGVQINYFLGILLLMSSAVMLPAAFADEEFHRPALG
jgi:drug/metabolite transporter (DMT)-like permease